MPFTPLHMGLGMFTKAVLQSSFSLMIFGWAQIVMDIQPLLVMITGEGHLHGFSHTYLGGTLLAVLSALSGKHLSEFGLKILGISQGGQRIKIRWSVTFASAFIGTFSHVALDSLMHGDLQPFYPLSIDNPFLGWLSVEAIHKLCLYSGLVGAAIYFWVQQRVASREKIEF